MVETASADHIPGVLALIEGASLRKGGPAYFLHVGGTGMLHEVPNGFGKPAPEFILLLVSDLSQVSHRARYTTTSPTLQRLHPCQKKDTFIVMSTWRFSQPRKNSTSRLRLSLPL